MTMYSLKPYRTVAEIIIFVSILYLINQVLYVVFRANFPLKMVYSISQLYLFFGAFAAIMLFILIKVKQKNIDNVGYTFLLLTAIKMGVAFWLAKPIKSSELMGSNIEKINFFLTFFLILLTETAITIRLLKAKTTKS